MSSNYRVIDGVMHFRDKRTDRWRKMSSKQLTNMAVELIRSTNEMKRDAVKLNEMITHTLDVLRHGRSMGYSVAPNVHRCMRCGSTSTINDEIASHPAYGC